MVRRHLTALACAVLLGAATRTPAVVQSVNVNFTGSAPWRAVLGKAAIGHGSAMTFYQWNLSVYDPHGHLAYESPRDGGPLPRVEKAAGGDAMWFPITQASIAGTGRLMGSSNQQLVVVDHEAAADCGSSHVNVYFLDAAMRTMMSSLSIENYCDLSAKIVHEPGGDALAVSGPYYAKNAALCCPTKNHATAMFRFHNGTWTQTPRYFTVHPQP